MGSKHQPITSTESLLASLSHYVNPSKSKHNTSGNIEQNEDETTESDVEDLKVTKSIDPFGKSNDLCFETFWNNFGFLVDINASEVNAACSEILDYASESESDVEAATYNSVWHDAHADSSDDESIDSEQEDILK